MTNLPADLSPETAAWLQAQMAINNARTAAVLREEINKVDDWANGIFAALRDAIGHLLGEARPIVGDGLARSWGKAAQDFDSIMGDDKATHHAGESLEQLEARALLYRFYVRLGMMPEAGRDLSRRARQSRLLKFAFKRKLSPALCA